MIRMLRALPIVALLALASFGAAGPSTASATTACPPSPTPGSSVHGNLEVPFGSICVLDHVTVDGSVTVDSFGELYLQNGAVVSGGISAGPASTVQIAFGSSVGGGVTMDSARIVTIASSTLSHGLSGKTTNLSILSSTVTGGISVAIRGEFDLCDSKVHGSVQKSGFGRTQIGDPPPDGEVVPVAAWNNVQVQYYTCGGNTITGSLTVQQGPVSIEANKISGQGAALTVTDANLELSGNTVSGGATCTGDIFRSSDDGDNLPGNTYGGPNNGCP